MEQAPVRSGGVLVFPVRHVDLGQRFLLKCLIPEACGDPDAVARFLRGARAAIHLTSEHTARTVDAGRFPSDVPYIVSETLSGCDLRETLLRRGALGLTEAVDLILQACEAVAEAHAQGLVHRNLNLSTLFATHRPGGSSFVKVLDFGIADVLSSSLVRTETYMQFGATPCPPPQSDEAIRCLAPEQIRGRKDIDAGADIWALGAILHELLAGSPVYSAGSVPCLLAMIVADPPVPITSVRSNVPAELESVILRCLEKERRARFPSIAEFAVALRTFASPEARGSIERVTRTLAQGRTPIAPVARTALVHVPRSPEPEAPKALALAPPPAAPPTAAPPGPAASHSSVIWVAAIIALGQIGGAATAVLLSRTPQAAPLVTEVSRAMPGDQEVQRARPLEPVAESKPPVLPAQPQVLPAEPARVQATPVAPTPPVPAVTPVRAAPVPAVPVDRPSQVVSRRSRPQQANDSADQRAATVRRDLFDTAQ
jgi:serine/threonine-protein kinase